MIQSVGIIGGGVVGTATARCFMEHAEVKVFDTVPERRTHGFDEVAECDLVFLCLPSPQGRGRAADITTITAVCKELAGHAGDFVLRSTVPVGTTKRLATDYDLSLIHWPEFLTARCANTDAQLPARNIIGGLGMKWNSTADRLWGFLSQRFPGVRNVLVTSDESELIKLACNAFFSAKVAFFNEIQQYATVTGCNWSKVLEGVLSDGRIAHSHTRVPGPDGHFGFAGACLPKDTANLASCMDQTGLTPYMLNATILRNRLDRARKE